MYREMAAAVSANMKPRLTCRVGVCSASGRSRDGSADNAKSTACISSIGKGSFRFKNLPYISNMLPKLLLQRCLVTVSSIVLLPSVSRCAHFPGRSEAVPSMSECFERELNQFLSRDVLLPSQGNTLSELL